MRGRAVRETGSEKLTKGGGSHREWKRNASGGLFIKLLRLNSLKEQTLYPQLN